MKFVVVIPHDLERKLRDHFFQSDMEQGGFLFTRILKSDGEIRLEAIIAYLVPPAGWKVQAEDFLELMDTERAKIMKIARDGGYALIDCHSHPGSGREAWFSYSDRRGITEFAGYVKWKLDGKVYVAMVWAESSIDAVAWAGDFTVAMPVSEVRINGDEPRVLMPKGTWWHRSPENTWQESGRWRRTVTLARSLHSGRKDKER